MTVEFVLGVACIVAGLGAIGAGLYLLGITTIAELLDGDDE
jgi:hypothetical protein